LGGMTVRWQYVPAPLLSIGRCMDLWLDGVAELPAHRITLLFHRSSGNPDQQAIYLDRQAWKCGEKVRLDSGQNLKWEPESVEIQVTFPDCSCSWRRTVALHQVAGSPSSHSGH
jgi:hypothetical protein